VRLSPLGTSANIWPIVPAPDDDDDDERVTVGGMKIVKGNRSTRRKPAPMLTLSTTNPIRPDLGSKPGRRGGKPVTNRLSCGAAFMVIYFNQFLTTRCLKQTSHL
jgi:hypothetical protein